MVLNFQRGVGKLKTLKRSILTPTLLLVVIVPLVTLLLFNVAVRFYVQRSARAELQTTTQAVEKSAGVGAFSGTVENEGARLRAAIRSTKILTDMKVLIYNSGGDLVFPRGGSEYTVSTGLARRVELLLARGTPDTVRGVTYLRERYLVSTFPVTGPAGNHYTAVLVAQTGAANLMMRVMNLILLIIMLAGIAVGSLVVTRLSNRISRPLFRLCRTADRIGAGNFDSMGNDIPDIEELQMISLSINRMSARLEASDKVQKAFLQNASHELRTPLMSIQGYAEGIARGIVPDVGEAAGIIENESRRLNTLVEELLTLSRIESRASDRSAGALNLCDVITEYAQRLGGVAVKMDRHLRLSLPESPVWVLADNTLLSQAVTNIVSNCLRYAGTAVTVALLREGAFAVINVSDDGEGIPPQDIPHLFERFYKGKGGNFGLGLAIAKSAVEAMGGSVTARNGAAGAVFEIKLPEIAPADGTEIN